MRAVIMDAAIILADEPTASLDEDRKYDILKRLEQYHQAGHTIIVVSHDRVFHSTGRQLELKDGQLHRARKRPRPSQNGHGAEDRANEAGPLEPEAAVIVKPAIPSIRRPDDGAKLLYGWRPRAHWSILLRQAVRETFYRKIFFFLVFSALLVGLCQVAVFASVIMGSQAYVEDAMTRGSRLNRVQISPKILDLKKEQRFPIAEQIASWGNVAAVVPRRQTVATVENIRGETISYVAMGLHDGDPEYKLMDFLAGKPFTEGSDQLEVIVTAALLQDLFDTAGLSGSEQSYDDFPVLDAGLGKAAAVDSI